MMPSNLMPLPGELHIPPEQPIEFVTPAHVPRVKCMFCKERKSIMDCVKVGEQQICETCLRRLGDMLRFHGCLT